MEESSPFLFYLIDYYMLILFKNRHQQKMTMLCDYVIDGKSVYVVYITNFKCSKRILIEHKVNTNNFLR